MAATYASPEDPKALEVSKHARISRFDMPLGLSTVAGRIQKECFLSGGRVPGLALIMFKAGGWCAFGAEPSFCSPPHGGALEEGSHAATMGNGRELGAMGLGLMTWESLATNLAMIEEVQARVPKVFFSPKGIAACWRAVASFSIDFPGQVTSPLIAKWLKLSLGSSSTRFMSGGGWALSGRPARGCCQISRASSRAGRGRSSASSRR